MIHLFINVSQMTITWPVIYYAHVPVRVTWSPLSYCQGMTRNNICVINYDAEKKQLLKRIRDVPEKKPRIVNKIGERFSTGDA